MKIRRLIKTRFSLCLAVIVVFSLVGQGFAPLPVNAQPGGPALPQDAPNISVASGVYQYTISNPDLFWLDKGLCPPSAQQSVNGPTYTNTDTISHIPYYGGMERALYQYTFPCLAGTGSIQSNIVSDGANVYFDRLDGLYRISINATPKDTPELVNASVGGSANLAIDDMNVYVMKNDFAGFTSHLYAVNKGNKQSVELTSAGFYAQRLSVIYASSLHILGDKGDYLLWLDGNAADSVHDLWRFNLNDASKAAINTGHANDYYAEGGRGMGPGFTDRVYVSLTDGTVWIYNLTNGLLGAQVYDAGSNSLVYDMLTDNDTLYFLQEYHLSGTPFTDSLMRRSRDPGGTTENLYAYSSSEVFSRPLDNLQTTGDYMFFQEKHSTVEYSQLYRLPKSATALPFVNMRATGLEVIQSVQKPDNSVRLIENKRTFARLFVKSDGPAVPGVTASLYGITTLCGVKGPLAPVNTVSYNLTVQPNPQRANLNDSYLFEFPWDWTTSSVCGPITFIGVLNPAHAPPQASYANNTFTSGPFTFSSSPRLQVQFVAWSYMLNNQVRQANPVTDIQETFSWIRRVYPLSSVPGSSADTTPGFRPNPVLYMSAQNMAAIVQGTDPICQDLKYKDSNGNWVDDRNLCASRFTNQRMVVYRAQNSHTLAGNLFFYGMIPDGKDAKGNWIFPRGQACCGTAVSSGPIGPDGPAGYFWWNGDGTYGDWYAAHEIGHTLGRGHPASSSATCGNSADDNGYPYLSGQIGADDNTEGFDAGDASLNQPFRVYPGTQWHDLMTYCSQQWISDYTFEAMYKFMTKSQNQPQLVPQSGDWLTVAGTIISGTDSATFNLLRRTSDTETPPDLIPGPYAIRLLDAGGATLAAYAFTPQPMDGAPAVLAFTQVVAFAASAKTVQIVRLSDNKALTSYTVPAHAPVVSGVTLPGITNPAGGTVHLSWVASHSDGLPLTSDIYYVPNSGTPRPLLYSASGPSTDIDTTTLPGGSGVLRVVASDGFNTAQGDSPAFNIVSKPPVVRILTPGNNNTFRYGQVINFSGQADDLQDGSLGGSNLSWKVDGAPAASGELWTSDFGHSPLQPGNHTVQLSAQNSAGLSSSMSITITVVDDQSLPGPTLVAGPNSFGWTFPSNTSSPQTGVVSISNAGSGTLDWTANTSAAWLKLSATHGTAPSSITITADPAGLPAVNSQNGSLVITFSGSNPVQTVTIPVGLMIGSYYNPLINSGLPVYLPVLYKNP